MVYKYCLPALLIIFASCAPSYSSSEYVLGAICTVTLFERPKDSISQEIFARVHEIDNLMSVNIPSSDISRINAAAGIESVNVHKDTFTVIERAVYFAGISGGAFDPSVGPLVSMWGIDGVNERIPSQEEIDNTLPMINWRDIELDAVTHGVFLKRKGMALDLGAIAKGYAADEATAIIKNAGVKRAIIDFGGNIVTLGEKKKGTPWKVGIQDPDKRRGFYFGVVQLDTAEKRTIVTSGVKERFFEYDGVRYHHILSTSNGYPVNNGFSSVTVVATNSMDADALSTTLFALDYERGINLLESFPGTEAIFVFEDNSVRITPGVNFTVVNNSFNVVN